MSSIYDWSTTPGNNTNSDGDIDWTEGQNSKLVNDSARAMMGRNAEFVGDIGGALTTGGTGNGITVTANSAFTTLVDGLILAFTAGADNTGSTTLNVNALGTKQIRKMTSAGDVALSGGEIQQNGIYIVQYSSAAVAAAGGWLLVNPTVVTGSTGDNRIVRFNGTSGSLQQSNVVLTDGSVFHLSLNTGSMELAGGNGSGTGANLQLFGGASATLPNEVFLDASHHEFRTESGGDGGSDFMTVRGFITARDNLGRAVFAANNNTIFLRPNGDSSTSGQMSITTGGNVAIAGNCNITGSLSKGSGTFLIEHPLDSEKSLSHGFVEAPRYDLIYRGRVPLVDGRGVVDIDAASNMSPGTFEALTTNAAVTSLQNQTGFSRCRPGAVVGGSFEIICEDPCADEIAWVVIAERNDAFVKQRDDNCDSEGRFIPERPRKDAEE